MPSSRCLCCLIFLTTFAWGAPLLADSGFAHEDTDLVPDPAIRYGTLDNGMRYALLANDTPPREAALRLRIDVGSLMEAEDQRGLAHFVEHMAFNGSENVSEGEMIRILERFGLAFGPDTNASTGFDETVYQLDLPDVGEEIVGQGLFLLREVAGNLTLGAEAIDRERGVVASEQRARNTPQFRSTRAQFAFLAPEARFPRRLPGGSVEVIRTAPRERFVDLYDRYYRPERAFLVLVGDLDLDAIEARLRGVFGDWRGVGPAGEDPDVGTVPPAPARAEVFVDGELPLSVSISAVKPHVPRRDDREARRRDLLETLAYAIVNRRFATLARAEEAAFFGAAAGRTTVAETADIASVGVGARPGRWREALAVGEQSLRRALEHGFTQGELDEQIANLRTALATAARSADTRQTVALATAVLTSDSAGRVLQHPSADLSLFEAQVATVTPEAVLEVLRSHWDGIEPAVFVASPEEIAGGPDQVLAVLEESSRDPVQPPEVAVAQSFAYTDFGPPGRVVERRTVEDLGVTLLRFDNGVMVNLKPTDFVEDRVALSLRVGSGKLGMPRELAGLDSLVSLGFSNMGLERHSADDLQRLLAGRTVTAGLGLGQDALAAGGTTTPEDLLLQLQLWAATLVAPGYRSEGLAQYRRTVESVYETLDGTPGGVLNTRGSALLHGGDPRFGLPPLDRMLALDTDDLRAFLDDQLGQGAVELTVVGDFETDAVIEAVSATLGALPRRREAPLRPDDRVSFPPPGTATLHHSGAPDQAIAAVYWETDDGDDPVLVAQTNLLESVLQLRLTDKVREELGASYSPGAVSPQSRVFDGFGYLGAISEVDAARVGEMVETLKAVALGLADEAVGADELQRARQPLLERLETGLESNFYWLAVLSQAQSRPGDLERHRQARQRLLAVTGEALQALAQRYLQEDRAFVLRVLPRPASGGS